MQHRAAIASASRSALADIEHMQQYNVRACTCTYIHGKQITKVRRLTRTRTCPAKGVQP